MAILLAGWAARRWATLPPLLPAVLALLLAGCRSGSVESVRVVISAPTPPAAPVTSVPVLWTGWVVLAVAGAVLLFILWRRSHEARP